MILVERDPLTWDTQYAYATDDNRQKLTAERAGIVGRGVETVNSHCTDHNVLLRRFDSFLRRNRIPVLSLLATPLLRVLLLPPVPSAERFCRRTKRSLLITRGFLPKRSRDGIIWASGTLMESTQSLRSCVDVIRARGNSTGAAGSWINCGTRRTVFKGSPLDKCILDNLHS